MITVVGLGPGDLDRLPEASRSVLLEPSSTVICRTLDHPAARALAAMRTVVSCDDLYESFDSYEEIYAGIRERVLAADRHGRVIYAVPGSPFVGEFAVREIVRAAGPVEVIPAESFVDAVLAEVGYDPLDRGLQVLNGHELPDPLVIDKPTIVGHLSSPEVMADVGARLDRVLPEDTAVTILANLGSPDQQVAAFPPAGVSPELAGTRTSLFVDSPPGGLVGVVRTMRRLREECPWDMDQSHQSLVASLVEEAYELIDAIAGLPPDGADWLAYDAVEDELGDVLLQVLFHSVIARQAGAFDIDDVAESLRRKLVRRHPHVFGDVIAETPGQVKANWERIKEAERTPENGISALSGVPAGMPALQRATKIQSHAARVGFDWESAADVLAKLLEEAAEMADALRGDGDPEAELGDLLFTVVNLARHTGHDPELALRAATARFESRFRRMEAEAGLADLDLDALNALWEKVKNR